jgi:hypothetical protein
MVSINKLGTGKIPSFLQELRMGRPSGRPFFLPSTWKDYWLIKSFEMSKEVDSEIIDEKKSDSLK